LALNLEIRLGWKLMIEVIDSKFVWIKLYQNIRFSGTRMYPVRHVLFDPFCAETSWWQVWGRLGFHVHCCSLLRWLLRPQCFFTISNGKCWTLLMRPPFKSFSKMLILQPKNRCGSPTMGCLIGRVPFKY
jgi:hypothetical protein